MKNHVTPGWAGQLVEVSFCTPERLRVQFPGRARGQVAGLIPGPGGCGRQLINVFLSHIDVSLSLSHVLSFSNQ